MKHINNCNKYIGRAAVAVERMAEGSGAAFYELCAASLLPPIPHWRPEIFTLEQAKRHIPCLAFMFSFV
jgi:hypothetical protein